MESFVLAHAAPDARVWAFDLDWTLIKPASGKVFPAHWRDWKWWHPSVPETLRALKGQLVICTNQRGLLMASRKITPDEFRSRMEEIEAALGRPVTWLVALDKWHKPDTALWFEAVRSGAILRDADITYVGDAGGRCKLTKVDEKGKERVVRKADHSYSDLHFAHRLKADFHFPEAFFLGVASEVPPPVLGAMRVPDVAGAGVVVMVGSPGSTKSTMARRIADKYGHLHLEQDQLGKRKLEKAADAALQQGQSIVVDATHRTRAHRARWAEVAAQHGCSCVVVWMRCEKSLAKYLNELRDKAGGRVAPVALHTYYKRLEEPDDSALICDVRISV